MGQCAACAKQGNQSSNDPQPLRSKRVPSTSNGTAITSTSTTMISSAKTDTSNGGSELATITTQQSIAEEDDTRERLLQFYQLHSPEKLNDNERITEILRRFKGREDELFATLNRKYTVTERPDSATNLQQARTSTITSTPDDATITAASPQTQPQAQQMQIQQQLNAPRQGTAGDSDYDDDHPILESAERRKSESRSLTDKNKKKSITPPHVQPQPQQEHKGVSKVAGLADAGLFKIEITRPGKKRASFAKKVLGTSLFGDGGGAGGGGAPTTVKLTGHNHQDSGSLGQRSMSLFVGGAKGHVVFDDDDDDLPKFGTGMARSNTLTLNRTHKDNLDKRRQSSLAVRRNQTRQNLPVQINKVWALFAQHVLEETQRNKQEEQEEEEEQQRQQQEQLPKQPDTFGKIQSTSNDTELTDLEATPEPADVLDAIINGDDSSKAAADNNNKNAADDHAQHMSMEVLAIDPRLFHDAKEKSRSFASSGDDDRESTSSDSNGSEKGGDAKKAPLVDVYALQVSNVQFNVVLNNHSIEISPDMISALLWLMLDVNGLLDDDIKKLGQESDNLHNNPMKERGFHAKQFKKIHKIVITYSMIETVMTKIANGAISRHDRQLHPKSLSYLKRNFVVWDKIFEHLLNKTSLNVEEEYLYGTLQESDLRDGEKIVAMLSSLETHWQHRLQLMEHIDDKLNGGSTMERDMFFATILFANENFIRILTGWSCQLTDDRSGVARAAVTLLPAVLSSILLCIQFPAVLFDEERVIHPIYDGIFTLVKNRRLKDMADDAYESLIQVTDILGQVAWDLEDYELMTMIINILEQHSGIKLEKHDKCREACIGGIGFLLYGIEAEPEEENASGPKLSKKQRSLDTNDVVHEVIATPIGALSDKDREEDIKMPDVDIVQMRRLTSAPDKVGTKLAKEMQRKELLQNDAFVASFGAVLKNGVTDKSESARRKAFKLLQRLEKEQDGELWTELQTRWDVIIKKKYDSWKKMNAKKSSTKLRPKRSAKKASSSALLRKKSNSKKVQSELKLKDQVQNLKMNASRDATPELSDENSAADARSSGMKITVTSTSDASADGASAAAQQQQQQQQ